MDELTMRVLTLMGQGFHCSQIMLLLSHEMRGITDDHAVRAMGGLGGGMFSRHNCGTLTGGGCVLASYGAIASPDETPRFDYKGAVAQLVEWFESQFHSVNCRDLVAYDRASILQTCPAFIAATFTKCMELLVEYGIDPND